MTSVDTMTCGGLLLDQRPCEGLLSMDLLLFGSQSLTLLGSKLRQEQHAKRNRRQPFQDRKKNGTAGSVPRIYETNDFSDA